ncbi:DUF1249 domain-containing protein [Shewanella sp. UCD-KL12]|uniref:DUF1249 domain-containing protein n=1 Tax=Shewanella sp. UCD-KL12 TaxID=1917163 RepID=UPI0009706068|nr:DUF1249 domain-containing protein [Shewanella sp. UCD-KL12]
MSSASSLNPKRYQPNINRFLALCGRNYYHILRWLPNGSKQGAHWQVEGEYGCLNVKLLENTAYTQLIDISRDVGSTNHVDTPKMIVRVYHDAKLAEVLTSRQIYQLSPVYDYPNIRMHHRDEKFQVNAFLEELLRIDNHTSVVCLAES